MNDAKPRAYSYVRFSTPEQAHGDSSRRQIDMARRYAVQHGLELDDSLTFQDLGVSAYRGNNTDAGQLGAFRRAVEDGVVPAGSYLLVENLDRLSRNYVVKALNLLTEIVELDITVVTLSDNREYTKEALYNDPMAPLISMIMFTRAHEESKIKADRLRASWEAKRDRAQNQEVMTSLAPAWIKTVDKQFELIPERAKIVREIFDRYAGGAGQNAIVASLNKRNEPTWSGGKMWHASYVGKILDNPAVIGTLIPHRMEWVDGKKHRTPLAPIEDYYPAVVDDEVFHRVRAIREQPRRAVPSSKDIKNLIAGLGRCPKCGGTMTRISKGSRKRSGRPYLICTSAKNSAGCDYKAVRYDGVEEAIVARAEELYQSAPTGDDGPAARRLERLQAGIEEADEALERLVGLVEQGDQGPALTRYRELQTLAAELDQQRTALLDEIAENTPLTVQQRLKELRETLQAEPLDRRKANLAMRVVVKGITIDYDRGLLGVEWRHGGTSELPYGWPDQPSVAS